MMSATSKDRNDRPIKMPLYILHTIRSIFSQQVSASPTRYPWHPSGLQ
jgi:hypothetical protein